MDQISIGGSGSYEDYSASLALRKIKMPKKKSIKETVPFSNVTYDFSAINGEIYWEDRELEYTFEITADNPEELEELKSRFCAWVMSISEQNLNDPFIPDYHFLATYDSMEIEDDEGLDKSTLTVTFTAYPYKIANRATTVVLNLAGNGNASPWLTIDSDHPVTLIVTSEVEIDMSMVSENWITIPGDSKAYKTMRIPTGRSQLAILNKEAKSGEVWFSYYREVI